jgi:transcriptional regulator with XRE-family HTH domain
MDINEATAKAISAERSAAGLTIKELAEKSGVPERTLIRILKDERDIKVDQLWRLSEVFAILPHELLENAERYMERDLRESFDVSQLTDEQKTQIVLEKFRQGDVTLQANMDPDKEAIANGGEKPEE